MSCKEHKHKTFFESYAPRPYRTPVRVGIQLRHEAFFVGCKYISFYIYHKTQEHISMDFSAYIRDIKDFPEPGVVFKDITPLLKDTKALEAAAKELYTMTKAYAIDKVVGVDSRGFIFAPMLATKLGAGFVPVRKVGKLPYKTAAQSYDLEYGTDTLEIHLDAIENGERVLVHDDVLATGGTAKAVCALVEKLGGVVVQCNFLVHLSFLKGEDKLNPYEVKSLLTY